MGHREDSIWWAKVGKIGSAVEILTGIACFGIMAGGDSPMARLALVSTQKQPGTTSKTKSSVPTPPLPP